MEDILDGKQWRVHHGDCIEHMAEMPAESIDLAITSVPFPSVFAYSDSDSDRDIGNSENLSV